MSSARPRPDNHPLLIVYIVGGVSINEVRALKEFRKPNFEVNEMTIAYMSVTYDLYDCRYISGQTRFSLRTKLSVIYSLNVLLIDSFHHCIEMKFKMYSF